MWIDCVNKKKVCYRELIVIRTDCIHIVCMFYCELDIGHPHTHTFTHMQLFLFSLRSHIFLSSFIYRSLARFLSRNKKNFSHLFILFYCIDLQHCQICCLSLKFFVVFVCGLKWFHNTIKKHIYIIINVYKCYGPCMVKSHINGIFFNTFKEVKQKIFFFSNGQCLLLSLS